MTSSLRVPWVAMKPTWSEINRSAKKMAPAGGQGRQAGGRAGRAFGKVWVLVWWC